MRYITFLLCFFLLSIKSFGLIVTLNLTWGSNISSYHLQEGSIVQVLAYTRNNASPPTQNAQDNFEQTGTENNLPVYDPNTTPNNHDILYQTQIQQGEDKHHNIIYYISEQFTTISTADRIYVRIFESTDLNQNNTYLSHWGLSSVRTIPNSGFITLQFKNINANHQNQFGFEVIPEPKTINLLLFSFLFIFLLKLVRFVLN